MVIRPKLYRSNEFLALESLPENAGRILELVNGEIVEKLPSFKPSKLAMRIGHFLLSFADDLGHVTGADGGYVMSETDVFNPDVGYISKKRLPVLPEREVPVPPDLAVEVKSPTDTKRALRLKVERYLAAGTRLVWLVFPEERVVEVYTPSEDVHTVGIDGLLDGGDVLPGFTLKVKDIFAGLD
jgi:Uma2 family endonuclease